MSSRFVMAAGLVLAGCTESPPEPPTPSPVSSIHQLMEDVVEPSAYVLWDATATTTDETGTHSNPPKTEEDWLKLRSAAVTLAESANLVTMEGRRVVVDGETMQEGGSLDASAIEELIAERRANFRKHGLGMQQTALQALKAVDGKDLPALFAIGGEMQKACESCHTEFWYPPETKLKAAP